MITFCSQIMHDMVLEIALSTFSLRDIHSLRQTCHWIHDCIEHLPKGYKRMLVLTRLRKAMGMQHDEENFERLLAWMNIHEIYISGGFVLQCILGENWNDGGDIDFFHVCETRKDFDNRLILMFEDTMGAYPDESPYEYELVLYDNLDLSVKLTPETKERLKINHIAFILDSWTTSHCSPTCSHVVKRRRVEKVVMPLAIKHAFDFSACMIYFCEHEQQVSAIYWEDVLNKEITIQHETRGFLQRKVKYERRGFTFL